jgi:hypothetical protein
VTSVLVESVSMSDAQSGAKKFRVVTSFGGVSTVVNAAFFEVRVVSFVLCCLRLILLCGSGLRCLRLAYWGARLQHGL